MLSFPFFCTSTYTRAKKRKGSSEEGRQREPSRVWGPVRFFGGRVGEASLLLLAAATQKLLVRFFFSRRKKMNADLICHFACEAKSPNRHNRRPSNRDYLCVCVYGSLLCYPPPFLFSPFFIPSSSRSSSEHLRLLQVGLFAFPFPLLLSCHQKQ